MKYRLFIISAVAVLAMTACQKKIEVFPRCFSVSETKQVVFAPGNLMYQASTNTYRFAEEQYLMMGYGNEQISLTNAGWIDLFGWGTGSIPTMNSVVGTDYAMFDDWGNHLTEPGWRTITYDEWNYLLQKRPNANKLIGSCQVEGCYGLIILPDNWDFSIDTVEVALDNDFQSRRYESLQWKRMEQAGAVFLPASGNRMGSTVEGYRSWGRYWTSTPIPMGCAFYFGFGVGGTDGTLRSNGRAVRLVKEITDASQVPVPAAIQ